jgi:superfamily II DNA or RNA helicase
METKIKAIEKKQEELIGLIDNISMDEEQTIKDVYELDDELYDFFNTKDKKYIKLFCEMVKSWLRNGFDIHEEFSKNVFINKKFIDYFFSDLEILKVKSKCLTGLTKDIVSTEEFFDEECIDRSVKFEWRTGQIRALENLKLNYHTCGIVNMITGSGKSLIFLRCIEDFVEEFVTGDDIFIILCPRIDVLRSLFFVVKDDKYVINDKNKKFWKDNNIIDLDNFDVVDGVNNKKSNEIYKQLNCMNGKDKLLIINNDYFRVIYNNIDIRNLIHEKTSKIIIDEVQCMTGQKIYDIITNIKYTTKISIVGFSATPIRPTKSSEENIINIFSKTFNVKDEKTLNLIYSYDLLNGIMDGIVLPYRIECVKINSISTNKIGLTNKNVLNDILEKMIRSKESELYYKKFVIWVKNKNILKETYKFIFNTFPEMKVYCTSSFDKELSMCGYNTDYDEYYKCSGSAILICINKCKEGSDIPFIDCGIYFDGCKSRSIVVSIQTSGRIIRPDHLGKKARGDIIDTFVIDEKTKNMSHTLTVQKILSYLTRLLNLADEETYSKQIDLYNKMSSLADNIEYDYKDNIIKIKLDDNAKHDTIMKMTGITIDWIHVKELLVKEVDDKFEIDRNFKLKIEYETLKKLVIENNIKTRNEYNDRDYIKNPEDKYYMFWKNWYDFLNIDTSIYPCSFNKLKKICDKYDITNIKQYVTYCKKYNLPEMPEELYDLFSYDKLFDKSTEKKRR